MSKVLKATLLIFLITMAPAFFASPVVAEENSSKLFVIIVCGWYTHLLQFSSFNCDTAYAYHVLSLHYSCEDINYLSTYPQDPGVNQTATKNNVRQAINRLATNSSLISKPDSNDIVFIYISTHGGGYNSKENHIEEGPDGEPVGRYDGSQGDPINEDDEVRESTLGVDANNDNDTNDWVGIDESIIIGNETVDGSYYEVYWDDELKQDIDGINDNATVIVARQGCLGENMSCYQGGLIDDLSDPDRNRIIMSSSNETWYSSGSYGEYLGDDGYGFSEWSERFFDALNGRRAFFDRDSHTVTESNTTANADLNGDWRVSMKEAWDWAWNSDEKRLSGDETPWFDDNGNKLPTYKNESDYMDSTDGQLASQTFLPPLPVDLSVVSVQPMQDIDLIQVYHNSTYRIDSIALHYNVTVHRADGHANPSMVNATVSLKRTNRDNSSDTRLICGLPVYNLELGSTRCLVLSWNESGTLNQGYWNISACINSTYYEEQPANNECSDGMVEARPLIGDVNGEGVVNILDAIRLSNAFGKNSTHPKFDPDADLNSDGVVNILDAITLANHFYEKMPWYGQSPGGGKSSGEGSASSGVKGAAAESTTLLVDPGQLAVFKGEMFTVSVKVQNAVDLRGWEFQLYWNNTVLNCTNANIQTPAEWQDSTMEFAPGFENNYNATHGRFFKAQSAIDPAPSFNGSMTIVTLTFQAMQPGTTSLTLTDTLLGNSTAQPITCSVSSGSVNVYYGRYMRSDIQTINGLNAYKLNIPESNSSVSNTQYGDEPVAYWGIRAWVRHSNGTEQELSLGGQTGTPMAVVSRGSGSGLQSATVTVAQTMLQPTDSLVVRVYTKVGTDSGWTLSAAFTTEQLQAATLQATTWTVYYYTYAFWNRYTETETAKLYWGTTTYNTRIQNLQYG
jgi:hypothetical protein